MRPDAFELEVLRWDIFVFEACSYFDNLDAARDACNRWPSCCCVVWDRTCEPKEPAWVVRPERACPELRQFVIDWEREHGILRRPLIGKPPELTQRDLAILRSMQKTGDWMHPPAVGKHVTETPIWRIHYEDGSEVMRERYDPKTGDWRRHE